jgi:hypothetical protein
MKRTGLEKAAAEVQARKLESLVRARGGFEHVQVQSRGGHLLVKAAATDGTSQLVARATRLAGREYGLSFRTHTGRWEPMPVSGSLEAIAEGLTGFLGPYLDAGNL